MTDDETGQPTEKKLRPGLVLLTDVPGDGAPVQRQERYRVRLRLWLGDGQAVGFGEAAALTGTSALDDERATLVTTIRINRGDLIAGLFYGVEGMRVGGLRRLKIQPHLAYGDRSVPGIPAGATLTAEITILEGPLSRG
jgi:hypothetical protein